MVSSMVAACSAGPGGARQRHEGVGGHPRAQVGEPAGQAPRRLPVLLRLAREPEHEVHRRGQPRLQRQRGGPLHLGGRGPGPSPPRTRSEPDCPPRMTTRLWQWRRMSASARAVTCSGRSSEGKVPRKSRRPDRSPPASPEQRLHRLEVRLVGGRAVGERARRDEPDVAGAPRGEVGHRRAHRREGPVAPAGLEEERGLAEAAGPDAAAGDLDGTGPAAGGPGRRGVEVGRGGAAARGEVEPAGRTGLEPGQAGDSR